MEGEVLALPSSYGRESREEEELEVPRCQAGQTGTSCPSLAVNPVFDPAEDSKDVSASRSRPSVSGTRQLPPRSHPEWQLAGATRELG